MESITNTLGNLRNTVVNAFNGPATTPQQLSLADVNRLEESERSRRLEQVSQARVDKQNANNVASLVRSQSFPAFKGNVSAGYKRVTHKYEDEERRRRLTNKSESALRRNNANHTARMIQKLGWPFYQQNHSGPEFITMDPTRLLEEEERSWRTNDAYWAPTAKHNAAMVAQLLRWGNFQKNPKAGFRYHTRFLEEKERKARLSDDVQKLGLDNAFSEAGLIRNMGSPFYVQETGLPKRDLSDSHRLEEENRKFLIKTGGRQMSSEFGGDRQLEEQERERRLEDVNTQKLAKQNAKQVSLMVRESSSNKVTGTGPLWFSISRNSMKALEEIERTRRVRDEESQLDAKKRAKAISDIVLHKWSLPAKPSSNGLEEEERQNRILDRVQQQVAVKNARKVSGMVARHNLLSANSKSFALAQEESERSRRLNDNEQQTLARDNAKKVSSLVDSLQVAPGHHVKAMVRSESLPNYHARNSLPPTAITMPATPVTSAPSFDAPISAPIAPIVAPVAPIVAPVAPIVAPVAHIAAPVTPISAPVAPIFAPVAPISAPLSKSVAPISAPVAPISAPVAPISAPVAPISAPLSKSVAPIVAPVAPIVAPVAPISAPLAKSVAPITAYVAKPIESAPISIPTRAVEPSTSFASLRSTSPIQEFVVPSTATKVPVAPLADAVTMPSTFASSAPIAAPIATKAVPNYSAPISTAPISAAPIATRAVPISTAPVTAAPFRQASSSSIPTTSAPMYTSSVPVSTTIPVAPTATTVPATAPFATPTVPVDSIALSHPQLGDRQRKKLIKQADRHNRKSEKDVKKAEQRMLKAEKLHQRGRDDKALKLEHKAETLMKAAEHEKKWADGIQRELAPNAPAPASM